MPPHPANDRTAMPNNTIIELVKLLIAWIFLTFCYSDFGPIKKVQPRKGEPCNFLQIGIALNI